VSGSDFIIIQQHFSLTGFLGNGFTRLSNLFINVQKMAQPQQNMYPVAAYL